MLYTILRGSVPYPPIAHAPIPPSTILRPFFSSRRDPSPHSLDSLTHLRAVLAEPHSHRLWLTVSPHGGRVRCASLACTFPPPSVQRVAVPAHPPNNMLVIPPARAAVRSAPCTAPGCEVGFLKGCVRHPRGRYVHTTLLLACIRVHRSSCDAFGAQPSRAHGMLITPTSTLIVLIP